MEMVNVVDLNASNSLKARGIANSSFWFYTSTDTIGACLQVCV